MELEVRGDRGADRHVERSPAREARVEAHEGDALVEGARVRARDPALEAQEVLLPGAHAREGEQRRRHRPGETGCSIFQISKRKCKILLQ